MARDIRCPLLRVDPAPSWLRLVRTGIALDLLGAKGDAVAR